ncbi:hypothetical protein SAMN06265337_1897 [Hymenobacter gelipurpurascens]|uniref:Uncharacterized protein n=1 Tax=Hymenobacter gelipurpurascens TaxID=89968 RepID=A0A212TN82_9BACT|nr:hypothetical protein [Hymenobacter gelipurpurascens]SNC67281.1 hypothetical protein SAMN06265337_1897 [Hymenobacter gelipurpurascens]
MKSQPSDASPELTQASQWTRNFRNQNPGAPKGHCIKKSQLDAILGQPGCEGIRVYYGLDDAGNRKLVMVGIDADENDIISTTTTAALRTASSDVESADTASVSVATDFPPCPPCCSIENPLNS